MPALLKTTQIQEPSSASVNLTLDTSGNGTFAGTSVMSSPYTMRNKIINGAMVIDQRNAGASITANAGVFPVDRFKFDSTQNGKGTLQQVSTAPSGFINSTLFTSNSSYAVLSSDYFIYQQRVEGLNVADLAWGTASAQTITVSFWVRSSLTGTFGGSIANSAFSRSYPFTFTVSSANTFEYKTVTIPGDTSGTWLTTNGVGLYLNFSLGSGSTYSGTAGAWASATYTSATSATSVVGTNGATFYITGVQLERGTVATPFEYRNYQQELAMCQRYYYRRNFNVATADIVAAFQVYGTGGAWGKLADLPVNMRANPTCSLSSVGHFYPSASGGAAQAAFASGTLTGTVSTIQTQGLGGSSGLTAGNATLICNNTTNAWIDASAEL